MPILVRKKLRQRLGQLNLHDTHVGINSASLGPGTASVYFIDPTLVNAAFSGESQYVRAWVWHKGETFRVASMNFPSGAIITNMTSAGGAVPTWDVEIHELLSPAEKDRALDWAINRLWGRQEVAINTVEGATSYSVSYDLGQVFNVWVNTDPTATAGPVKGIIPAGVIDIQTTATGRALRLGQAFGAGQQIVIDAEVRLSLGSGDEATMNYINEAHLLYAAESQAWEMIAKRAPAQDRRAYLQNAQRAAAAYSRLSQRFAPQRDSAPRFRTQMI